MTFVPPLPDNSRCPRCGGPFRCGAEDPAPCACATAQLDKSAAASLRDRYPQGCLCLACLQAVARESQAS